MAAIVVVNYFTLSNFMLNHLVASNHQILIIHYLDHRVLQYLVISISNQESDKPDIPEKTGKGVWLSRFSQFPYQFLKNHESGS